MLKCTVLCIRVSAQTQLSACVVRSFIHSVAAEVAAAVEAVTRDRSSTSISTAIHAHSRLLRERAEVSPALLAAIDRAVGSVPYSLCAGLPLLELSEPCSHLRVYPPECLKVWANDLSSKTWSTVSLRRILSLATECQEISGMQAQCTTIITSSCRVLRPRINQVARRRTLPAATSASAAARELYVLVDACRLAGRAALLLPGGLRVGTAAAGDVVAILADLGAVLSQADLKAAVYAAGPVTLADGLAALSAAVCAHNSGLLLQDGGIEQAVQLPLFHGDFVQSVTPRTRRSNRLQPASSSERAVLALVSSLCADAGLPPPQHDVALRCCGITVDVAWEGSGVVLEVDGPAHAPPLDLHSLAAGLQREGVVLEVDGPAHARPLDLHSLAAGLQMEGEVHAEEPPPSPLATSGTTNGAAAGSADLESLVQAYSHLAPGQRRAQRVPGRQPGAPSRALVLPLAHVGRLLHLREWGGAWRDSSLTRLRTAALRVRGWQVVQALLVPPHNHRRGDAACSAHSVAPAAGVGGLWRVPVALPASGTLDAAAAAGLRGAVLAACQAADAAAAAAAAAAEAAGRRPIKIAR